MHVNFRDKNFMITMFFCDYLRAMAPAQTIHVVAPPKILTRARGIELAIDNNEQFRILVLQCVRGFQSVWTSFVGKTRKRETSNLRDLFAVKANGPRTYKCLLSTSTC